MQHCMHCQISLIYNRKGHEDLKNVAYDQILKRGKKTESDYYVKIDCHFQINLYVITGIFKFILNFYRYKRFKK